MRRHTAALSLLLLLSPLAAAQSLTFGERFALTNTRYGTAVGEATVQSNGRDFFLFWQTETNLRVTKLVGGEVRAGQHVLDHGGFNPALASAVAWTGTHFFVVSTDGGGLIGRLLDANGHPAGETFRIAHESSGKPAVASNGRTVLVLHKGHGLQAVALTLTGAPTGVASTVLPTGPTVGVYDLASNGDGFVALIQRGIGITVVTYDGDGRERSRGQLSSVSAGTVAIASDGRDYLGAWQVWTGAGVAAARILADGSIGPEMTVDPVTSDGEFVGPLDMTWTGTSWAIAYAKQRFGGSDRRLRVTYLDGALRQVIGYEDVGTGFYPVLAAANGRVMMTWRPSLGGTTAVASLLPLHAAGPEPATFGAAGQDLLATASTPRAALAVWNEVVDGESTLHAGVREANGNWRERRIAPRGSRDAFAATDGQGFAVVTGGDSPSIVFLDAGARITAGPVSLSIRPRTIAWDGTHYLVADTTSIARLNQYGFVSSRATQPMRVKTLGSNGTATMAILVPPEPCPVRCPEYGRPHFAQIGPDLRPIGAPRLITADEGDVASHVELVWDGTRFLAAWVSVPKVIVAELPLDGGPARIAATFRPRTVHGSVRMAAVEGGVALTWRGSGVDDVFPHTRVALVRHDDSVSSATFDDALRNITQPHVVPLANGGIGHLATVPQLAPPHHGSKRIVMRVADAVLPAKPEAPRLTGEGRDGRVELAWTAPPQEIAGYRIEYRIGDGAWNELDRWFDWNDDEIAVEWALRKGVPYRFRIRAFNDAGTSEYSAPVLVNLPKRRSVR